MTASMKARYALCSVLFLSMLIVPAMTEADEASGTVTIMGVVNVTGQIVTDAGESYFIVDDRIGREVSRLVGRLVEVRGFVEGAEDARMITVMEYREVE
ncbi:MAG: hypothetical protein NT072_00405 [Deltaproteobacteria bacterium]|nr:hypothetical protein [Deltaproteobacteria bacterium]